MKRSTIVELAKAVVEQDKVRQVDRKTLMWIMERIADDNRSGGYVPKDIQKLIDEKEGELNEDTRRNCNWCGYQLIDEQVDPDLCGACYAQYLKENGNV